ncbi:hypothetical protein GOV08_04545 [Candidatus Woesearchaeota archaeon]|nr:hypothetical protein [Candidatus Woesearchaeota archaeon]
MHDNLIERLNDVSEKVDKDNLVDILLNSKPTNISHERLDQKSRDELVPYITEYISRSGVEVETDFQKKLYFTFNPKKEKGVDGKKAGKNVLYTIIDGLKYADNIPSEIFEDLNQWEAVYFLAGLNHSRTSDFIGDRYTKTKLNAWSTQEIIARTILKGVDKLNKIQDRIGKTLPHRADIEKAANYVVNPQMDMFG